MTDKPRPKLSLKLSGNALAKLQAKIPKPYVKPITAKTLFKDRKESGEKLKVSTSKTKDKASTKKRSSTKPPPKSEFDVNQYFYILKALEKKAPQTFPPKDKPLVPLAIGIHKDIAKLLEVSNKKAFYFCRMYCGTQRYKEVVSKSGSPRYNLEGEESSLVD